MNSSYGHSGEFAKDERDGCRSLICDANGIIVAEMVYRCMICSSILESVGEAKAHYHKEHIDADDPGNGHHPSDPIVFPDGDASVDMTHGDSDEEEDESSISQPASNSLNFNSYEAMISQHTNNSFDSHVKTTTTTTSGRKKAGKALSPSKVNDVKVQTAGTNGTCTIKSGYITCPVCSCTKFYTTLQRRYGQFSCVGCYRFFKEFFVRPKRFLCPTLGSCPLDQRTKCKACWIKSCMETYTVDDARKELLFDNRPLQKSDNQRSPSSRASNGSSGVSSAVDNVSPHDMGEQQTANTSVSPLATNLKEENDMPHSPDDHDGGGDSEDADGEEAEQQDEGIEDNASGGNLDAEQDEDEVDEDEEEDSGAAASPTNMSMDYPIGSYNNESPASLLKTSSKLRTPPRRKTSGRIKNWCCLKCQNCLADDCGKCINCLDRPKFGGPFIRKQRCLYKKCLMKMTMKTPQ